MDDKIITLRCFKTCPFTEEGMANACVNKTGFSILNPICNNELRPILGNIYTESRKQIGKSSFEVAVSAGKGNFVFTSSQAREIK